MKTLTTILTALAFVAISSSTALAQDDDDDLFGDGDTTGDGDMGDGTGDTGDTGDTGGDTGDTTAPADTAVAGGVAKSSGKLGVGFSTTTTNLSGVEAEYWLSNTLVVSGLARITLLTGDADLTGLQLGGGALLVLKDRGKAALMVGGRFILGYLSVGDASATSIAIEAPLRLQMAMHENISMHVEGGLALLIGDQAGLGGDPTTSFGLGIGTNNLYGSAGITFYF